VTAIASAPLASCTGGPGSDAATVRLCVPIAVGVPEITPVAALRLNPAGSDPWLSDQL
jgi:hypothetical protein